MLLLFSRHATATVESLRVHLQAGRTIVVQFYNNNNTIHNKRIAFILFLIKFKSILFSSLFHFPSYSIRFVSVCVKHCQNSIEVTGPLIAMMLMNM